MCGVCSDDYFSTDISGCKRCPASANSAAETVGTIVFLLALGAAMWKLKERIERKHPKLAAAIGEKLPEVMKLLTGLFQILGAFTTVLYRVPWPDEFRHITSIASILSLNIFALPNFRCSDLGDTFYGRFTLHLTTMLTITALLIALLFYAYSRHNQRRAHPLAASLVWNIFLPFLFIICECKAPRLPACPHALAPPSAHPACGCDASSCAVCADPSISKTVILMLRCRTIDGRSYLLSDIGLSCETAQYASHKAYAIFGVLVFPIGVAVLFTAVVGRSRRKLPPDWWPARAEEQAKIEYGHYRATRLGAVPFKAWRAEFWDPIMAKHSKLHQRLGFLFAAYHEGYWWFEPVLLLYKLSMTVLILFVSDSDENKSLVRVCALLCLLCANLPTALTVHSLLLLCSVA